MKRSIGLRTQAGVRDRRATPAGAGGTNAQCVAGGRRRASRRPGACAPWSIQARSGRDLGLGQRRPLQRHPLARPLAEHGQDQRALLALAGDDRRAVLARP